MKRQVPVLEPQYLHKFQCLGSTCEDSCCTGNWHVLVDRETYDKYDNLPGGELRTQVQESIRRNPESKGDVDYATINWSHGRCPFLTGQSLCGIQQQLGEDHLPVVCSTYPRVTNQVDGNVERSGSVSCPEIARLALLNPQPMEFDRNLAEIDLSGVIYGQQVDSAAAREEGQLASYFWDLRVFTIQVLQDRSYTLTQRLLALGLFYQKAQEALDAGQSGRLPGLVQAFAHVAAAGEYRGGVTDRTPDYLRQVRVLKLLVDMRIQEHGATPRYQECLNDIQEGLALGGGDAEVLRRYQQANEQVYTPFQREHGYILENFLVNYVFRALFPLNRGGHLFAAYVGLVLHYSLIQWHLIGLAARHGELPVDVALKGIQTYSANVEHDTRFLDNAQTFLQQRELFSLTSLFLLMHV